MRLIRTAATNAADKIFEDNKTIRRAKRLEKTDRAGQQKKQVVATLVSPEKMLVKNNEVNELTTRHFVNDAILVDENVSSNEDLELKSYYYMLKFKVRKPDKVVHTMIEALRDITQIFYDISDSCMLSVYGAMNNQRAIDRKDNFPATYSEINKILL